MFTVNQKKYNFINSIISIDFYRDREVGFSAQNTNLIKPWITNYFSLEDFNIVLDCLKLSEAQTKENVELNTLKKLAFEKLKHFRGYWKKKKIMTDDEFVRMLKYTWQLIETRTVPIINNPIGVINITKGHLTQTFYRIHQEVIGRGGPKELFVEFMISLFPKTFEKSTKKTNLTKFSQCPDGYDTDVETILKSIK